MDFKEGDEVVLVNLKPGQSDYENGKEGVVIDVDFQIMVQFVDDYWWFDRENIMFEKSYLRDLKLKELGI